MNDIKPGRIEKMFEKLSSQNKKAFIPFITTGDPSVECSCAIISEMIENGASLIQLGVPYSDPSAEGPVIMRADARALKNGTRMKDVFELTKYITKKYPEIPLILTLYYNMIFVIGADRFFRQCVDHGVDGVILPDLPYEEQDEIWNVAQSYNVRIISMVSPISYDRAAMICKRAQGFLYCISSVGVMGEHNQFHLDYSAFSKYLNQNTNVPKVVGIGISTTKQVNELKNYCDGVIIGSEIVRQIENAVEENKSNEEIAKKIGKYTLEICTALNN